MSLLIERLEETEDVFDITVDGNHNFFANGILVHNCTEITLLNNEKYSFVCNLSSPNLAEFEFTWDPVAGLLNWNPELEKTVRIAVRALDNVITTGFIPHEKGRRFQEDFRAVGLGAMGWTVCLAKHGIDYESAEHVKFANEVFKQLTITGIDESANLARERGAYPKFHESEWAKGILPVDNVRKFKVAHEYELNLADTNAPFLTNGLESLREKVKGGMRNSSLFAIAPTATIANIAGTSQCTEQPWDLVQEKENLSGQFDYVSPVLIHNRFGLKQKAARELDHRWTVRSAIARGFWIDQAQSTNINTDPNSMNTREIGDYLDDLVFQEAYEGGLKTFYYCYSQSANLVTKVAPTSPGVKEKFDVEQDGAACFLRPGDPGFEDCEACQ